MKYDPKILTLFNSKQNMRKVVLALFLMIISALQVNGQVAKKVIVEHFTNSRCSVCANRNPGFYSNLDNHPGILHLAFYPSSPYATCLLNQHNVAEPDARANYYSVYGSTPRIVIQGSVIASGDNYSIASLFIPFTGQTSPASLKIVQYKFANDSIRTRITIKTEATHTLGGLKLFVGLAEDTVFYASPNGETRHYDVFRKSLGPATGMSLTLPPVVGDSVVVVSSSTVHAGWNFSRIFTTVILQDAVTREVVQSEASSSVSTFIIPAGITQHHSNLDAKVYPNPVSENLWIKLNSYLISSAKLYDLDGKEVYKAVFENNVNIALSTLTKGHYLLVIENSEGKLYKTISKD